MGAGASTHGGKDGMSGTALSRLRKSLLLRAYNVRKGSEQVLLEQFRPAATMVNGTLVITVEGIRKVLGLAEGEHTHLEQLAAQLTLNSTAVDVPLVDFIEFLETGVLPKPPAVVSTEAVLPPPGVTDTSSIVETVTTPSQSTAVNPVQNISNSTITPQAIGSGILYRPEDEVISIHLGKPGLATAASQDRIRIPPSTTVTPVVSDRLEVIIRPRSKGTTSGDLIDTTAGPVWRKVERVVTERTVEYSTVDPSGERQDLIEREIEQREAVHLECRETGTFAHRETAKLERLEVFNGQIVNEVNGQEEYLHFKSPDDEFHCMESTMPPKDAPPPSEDLPPQHNEPLPEGVYGEDEMVPIEGTIDPNVSSLIEGKENPFLDYDDSGQTTPALATDPIVPCPTEIDLD